MTQDPTQIDTSLQRDNSNEPIGAGRARIQRILDEMDQPKVTEDPVRTSAQLLEDSVNGLRSDMLIILQAHNVQNSEARSAAAQKFMKRLLGQHEENRAFVDATSREKFNQTALLTRINKITGKAHKIFFDGLSKKDLFTLLDILREENQIDALLEKGLNRDTVDALVLPIETKRRIREWQKAQGTSLVVTRQGNAVNIEELRQRVNSPQQDATTASTLLENLRQRPLAANAFLNISEILKHKLDNHLRLMFEAHEAQTYHVRSAATDGFLSCLLDDLVNSYKEYNFEKKNESIEKIAMGLIAMRVHGNKLFFEGLRKENLFTLLDILKAENKLDVFFKGAMSLEKQTGFYLPESTRASIEEWKKAQEPQKYDALKGIAVVEVHLLLPPGENFDTDIEAPARKSVDDTEAQALRTEPRLEWLIAELESAGYQRADMLLTRQRKVTDTEDTAGRYTVLEALKDDGLYVQVAVCNTVGYATYVIRTPNPLPFNDSTIIQVRDLKHNPDVFQFSCFNQEQWISDFREYAFSEREKLGVQVKTITRWAALKQDVINTFMEYCISQGQLPKEGRDTPIECGPLAGKTTWPRLRDALASQSIEGLEDCKNLRDLAKKYIGDDYREQLKCLRPSQAFEEAANGNAPHETTHAQAPRPVNAPTFSPAK